MKILISTLIFFVIIGNLHSQGLDIAYPHVTPMSPNAAELAKYADIPISYFTGTPNISVPLYEIEVDGLKLPISLNYHASGIKVDQEATWVGLGWSLDVGGRISRIVKSADDFKDESYDVNYPFVRKGYFRAPEIGATLDNHYEIHGYDDCIADLRLQYELIHDPEPDIFFYNLPNMNGKFILDKSRGAVLFDKSHNLKIEVIGSGPTVRFKVIDKDGNQYLYNKSETTSQFATNGWLNKNLHTSSTVYDSDPNSFIHWQKVRGQECTEDADPSFQAPYRNETSWCLTQIITKHGREINFTYDSETLALPTQESCENYNFNNQSWLFYNKSKVVNYALRLRSIEGDFGRVEFNCTDRFDMKSYADVNLKSKKLESLSVYNNTNALIKSYRFDYTYFNDDYSGNYQYEHVFKRLKLNKVTEYCLSESSLLVPLNNGYTFDYYAGNFPPKNSKNVDYWGFQNGKSYGAEYYVGLRINTNLTFNGRKKDADFDKALIGTLKKITYPTGGVAEYTFESNTTTTGFHLQGNTYEWLPPTGNNLLSLDVFNYHVSSDYELYSYLPRQEINTFVIEQQTKVKINCELENTMMAMDPTYYYDTPSHPLGRLRRISPTTSIQYTYSCPFLFDYSPSTPLGQGSEINLTEREFILVPGTYEFEAYQPPRDVLASWRLHFDRPLPTQEPPTSGATWPYKGGGIRISQIKTDAKTRKFSYDAGTAMRAPVLFYGGTRIGIPNNAGCIVQVSESQTPLSSFGLGNYVGYDWVEEYMEDEDNNISKTRYTFHAEAETELFDDNFPDIIYLNYRNGLPQSIERWKIETSPILVEKEQFLYTSTYSINIKAFRDRGLNRHDSDLVSYYYRIEWPLETQHSKTTVTDAGQSIVKETNYTYNSRDLIASTSYELNNSEIVEKVKYPFDFTDATNLSMINKNMIGIPVESIMLKDNKVVQGTKTQYGEDSGIYLPKTIWKTDINTDGVSEAQYNSYYQPFLTFNDYDSKGNLLEVSRPHGIHTFYVWGYNDEYPIAKIENFDAQVNMTPAIESLINNAKGYSENDNDRCTDNVNCSEKQLRIALNELRNALSGSIVTTYTYDPLIGMTSTTDANNVTTYYEYDTAGRLKFIRDKENNILKTYEYKYKGVSQY